MLVCPGREGCPAGPAWAQSIPSPLWLMGLEANVPSGMSSCSPAPAAQHLFWWCWLAAGRTEELSSCWTPPCAAAQIWVFKDLCDFRGCGSLWKWTKTGNLSQLWKSWDKFKKVIKYEEHSLSQFWVFFYNVLMSRAFYLSTRNELNSVSLFISPLYV